MFYLTATARKRLLIFCKSRNRNQCFLRFYCLTQRKYQFRRSISTDHRFGCHTFIFGNCFFQRCISDLRIIFHIFKTVTYRLLYTFRRSQWITVCRKIQTVLISIDITAMYVLRHSFSPFCVPLQKHNAEQNTDDHTQNRRCIHQAVRITNIFCLYFPNRVSNCRFLI